MISSLLVTSLLVNAPLSANLIDNGDFSSGHSGFKTDYTYSEDLQPTGTLFIGQNPNNQHPGGFSMGDHTSGSGLMLIADGSEKPDVTVWQHTVPVVRHHQYTFVLWAASWGKSGTDDDASPARLVVTINGTPVGRVFTLKAHDGVWSKFRASWDSDATKSAKIRIVDQNTDGYGNDFAIDDIGFHLK